MNEGIVFAVLWVLALCVQGFYSMMEMALVSFNRIKLHFLVDNGNSRAKLLRFMMQNPSYLFGTTLIGVNVAMMFGAECVRRACDCFGIDVNYAPWIQIVVVLIFAELSPLFAARRFPESLALMGAKILFVTSVILKPIISCLDMVCRAASAICGGGRYRGLHLTRAELRAALGEIGGDGAYSDPILESIFLSKDMVASDLMEPISNVINVGNGCSVGRLKNHFRQSALGYVAISLNKGVVSIIYNSDLLDVPDSASILPYIRSPWLIVSDCPVMRVIEEFLAHKEDVAVVLDKYGVAIGILAVEMVINMILFERSVLSVGNVGGTYLDYVVSSRVSLKDLRDAIGVSLVSGHDDESLGGFLERTSGKQLCDGAIIDFKHIRFEAIGSRVPNGLSVRIKTRSS